MDCCGPLGLRRRLRLAIHHRAGATDDQQASHEFERKRNVAAANNKFVLDEASFSWADLAMTTALWLAYIQVGLYGLAMCYTLVAFSLGVREVNIVQNIRALAGL